MATKKKKVADRETGSSRKTGMGLAIVALILNVVIIPGLGSLIAGKTKTGIWQLALTVVGFVLSFVYIGIPIIIVAWIWGLVTGVQLIQNTR